MTNKKINKNIVLCPKQLWGGLLTWQTLICPKVIVKEPGCSQSPVSRHVIGKLSGRKMAGRQSSKSMEKQQKMGN